MKQLQDGETIHTALTNSPDPQAFQVRERKKIETKHLCSSAGSSVVNAAGNAGELPPESDGEKTD